MISYMACVLQLVGIAECNSPCWSEKLKLFEEEKLHFLLKF